MHALHDYVAKQLAEKLKARKVVVWYDAREEFVPFIVELRGSARASREAVPVTVAGLESRLTEYDGSMFELRAIVESYVSGDVSECVVIYLPGCERDRRGSVLMELEKAGECYEPQLKRLARNVLRLRYTDGVIDEMLAPERVTYEDLARASSDTSATEPPSILKSIFHDTSGNDGLLGAWLASDARDAEIEAKEATRELTKLLRSRLGLDLPDDSALAKIRSITLRYVLAGEFRSDLSCAPPAALDAVPAPTTKDEEAALRELARRLRTSFPEVYSAMADRVEAELGLRDAKVPPDSLGSIDTFRFEERVLLAYCGDLIAAKRFDQALAIISEREHSFWLDRDVARKAQWEACRRMAELGRLGVAVRARNFRCLRSVNVELDPLTVLIGQNNSGKTSFLNALFAAIGSGQRVISNDDIFLCKSEVSAPKDRPVAIDILIRPTDDQGQITDVFPQGSAWIELWGLGIVQDQDDKDLVAIRTLFKWNAIKEEYILERRFLKDWQADSTKWEARRIFTSPMPRHNRRRGYRSRAWPRFSRW